MKELLGKARIENKELKKQVNEKEGQVIQEKGKSSDSSSYHRFVCWEPEGY